ncbi:GNAT family N-acetyltransferase [Mycolicibacterium sp. XJ870]
MSAPVVQIDRIANTDERFGHAKRWEYQIFGLENGYTCRDDDAAEELCQLRRWEQSSEFFVARDSDDKPIGILRALRCDPDLGIDSFSAACAASRANLIYRDWQAFFATVSPIRVAELATCAVTPSRRKSGVAERLWQPLAQTLATDGVRYVTVALPEPLFDRYRATFGDAIEQFGDILPGYLVGDRVPAVVDLDLL